MKLSKLMICVVLLGAALQFCGQQPDSATQAMAHQRLGRPGFPTQLQKPILAGAQTAQPSDGLPRNDDTIATFDAPGALNAPGAGTIALSINPAGEISGFYLDVNYGWHGFLREVDGTITSFDPPGSVFTVPGSINPRAEITGYYYDSNYIPHGFLRARQGTFSTFDLPAGGMVFTSLPPSINARGTVAGNYLDASGVIDGFLRTPDGTFTNFHVPGADGTFADSINSSAEIAGYYDVVTRDPSFSIAFHGFLRARDGRITTIDVPGAMWTFVLSNGINPEGAIAGYCQEADYVFHGFLRKRDGTFTTFDVPGAGTGAFQGTGGFGVAINPADAIAGTYVDLNGNSHGFLRDADGTISTFDPAGSVSTFPGSINPAGAIAGSYVDASGSSHGFVRTSH